MDENFKFFFFLFFSSSLGSHTRATLLAELALKRQFGKDSRRGKQEDCGLHNETGEACPKGKAGKLRAARHSACRDCLQAATRTRIPATAVFFAFFASQRKSENRLHPSSVNSVDSFPPRGSLDEGKDYPFCRKNEVR